MGNVKETPENVGRALIDRVEYGVMVDGLCFSSLLIFGLNGPGYDLVDLFINFFRREKGA